MAWPLEPLHTFRVGRDKAERSRAALRSREGERASGRTSSSERPGGGQAKRAAEPGERAPVDNAAIARALQEIGLFLEMEDVPFKPQAYEAAALAVGGLEEPLAERYADRGIKGLVEVPGIGKGIARRIAELLETGHCPELERLRTRTPVDVVALTAVEGLGPKQVKRLYEALGITSLDELEEAARAERIRRVPHFGEKTERKIARGIGFVRETHGRLPLGEVLELAESIAERLRGGPSVLEAAVAGSVRRRKDTVGDLDFLVAATEPERVMEAFLRLPEVVHVHAHGPTKTLVRLRNGLDGDLRVVPASSWGAALCYFTGNKDHNVSLRRRALGRGLKLNEYGLFEGERQLAGCTEEEVYAALDLSWVPPEMREDTGEIEAAAAGDLPQLIEGGALRGDLQVQTSWTDGANTMQEMAEAARRLGFEYIAITDHTRDLPTARGNDEARLLEQLAVIRALDARLDGIRILAGAEVNVRSDGSLDIADEVLAQLDLVGVGVHSNLQMSREEMTARLIRAIENPHVDVLFHPTGRLLGKRPACDLDLDALLRAARRTGTALEIDGRPDRLDLKDEHVRRALDAGVKLVIDSDAHSAGELRFARDYGVAVARRGWATANDVLNTLPLGEMLARLKAGASPSGRPRPAPLSG